MKKLLFASFAIIATVIVASCSAEQIAKQVDTLEQAAAVAKPAPTVVVSRPVAKTGWLKEYDTHIKSLVTEDMINAPDSRMKKFCDVWPALTREERKQFFADVLYSIAKPESSYNPQAMYIEDTMGKDLVTGLPVASEGFMQISYQDASWYKECKFDWAGDKAAFTRDMTLNGSIRTKGGFTSKALDRSIQNPYTNLGCGVAIVKQLMKSRPDKEFADTMGLYWSTMRREKKSNGVMVSNPHYKMIWQQMNARNSKCK